MSCPAKPPEERFWQKVDKGSSCWLWMGSMNLNGYGRFFIKVGVAPLLAHRFAYQLANGSIGDGLQIDHLCRIRSCVNPDHLEVVTPRVNTLRGDAPSAVIARSGHCRQGHIRTELNTYICPSNGARECRQCRRERWNRTRSYKHGGKAL